MKATDLLKNALGIFDMHSELDIEAAAAGIRKNSDFRGMNVWILVCAIITASLGLNVNSTAVIIGAMLISPLMGPIIGFGLAVGTNDINLMRSTLRNLGVMVAISIIASTLFFFISPLNMQHPSELLARTRPTIFDVMIAFVGGAAGALETSRREKGTVISGVAIATALMPPLCTVGYGLSNLDIKVASGAFYLFFINCVFVALATFIVVKYLGFPKAKQLDPALERRAARISVVFILLLVVPSVFSAVAVVRENNFNSKSDALVAASNAVLESSVIYNYKADIVSNPPVLTLYIAGNKLSDTEKETLFSSAEEVYGIGRHQIRFETAFTSSSQSDFEKQVYSDMNSEISDLKSRLRAYESQILPYEQISLEVRAIYPQIEDMALARGSEDVFAIISYKDSTQTGLESGLGNWLKLRLGVDNVCVVRNVVSD